MVPRLRAPIVLVHGLFGFERLRVAGLTLSDYFPSIPEMLRAAGNRALVPFVSPTAAVADRAAQLKDFLDIHSPGEPVHLIAHSMGGLDSRYMISRLGMAERVLSLTTLGTPHRGTIFADWAISKLERIVKPMFEYLALPTQGFYDLTTKVCRKFNHEVPDVVGVRYFSVAGKHDGNLMNPEWLLPYVIVMVSEGPNDGVVSVASATWGEHVQIWHGDHFSLVNWSHPFGQNRTFNRDPERLYGPILQRLKDEGF